MRFFRLTLVLGLGNRTCKKTQGIVTYIVPKSLTFSEGWKQTRDFVAFNNKLIALVDVSKAFENVLLEQVIICFKTEVYNSNYYYTVGEGWSSAVEIFSKLETSLIKELGILPVYIDKVKQNIYSKMIKNSILLSNISETFRGLPVQKSISLKGKPILRGKNIGKYSIYSNIDNVFFDKKFLKKAKQILQTKIISQNIVAHVVNPTERIIIMATIDTKPYLTLDTVMNTIINNPAFNIRYILSILNSTFASWFYYWFVYNRAIRTMHFDEYYVGKLLVKKISKEEQQPFVTLVDLILASKAKDPHADTSELEQKIDRMVYELYGLTDEEIAIVEGR